MHNKKQADNKATEKTNTAKIDPFAKSYIGAPWLDAVCEPPWSLIFVSNCTSTRRFCLRPSAVVFGATSLSLPIPIR